MGKIVLPVKNGKVNIKLHRERENLMNAASFAALLDVTVTTLMSLLNRNPLLAEQIPVRGGSHRFPRGMAPRFRKLIAEQCQGETAAKAAALLSPSDREQEAMDTLTYGDVRTKRELYAAKKAQLDYERASGRLVSTQAVERLWNHIAVSVQKAVLTVPDRVTPLLVGEAEHTIIHTRLTTELKIALKNLAFSMQDRALMDADVAAEVSGRGPGRPNSIVTELKRKAEEKADG